MNGRKKLSGWFSHTQRPWRQAALGKRRATRAPLIKHTRAHPARKDRRPAASLCSGWWISRCGALARDAFAAITLICPNGSKSWKTRARLKDSCECLNNDKLWSSGLARRRPVRHPAAIGGFYFNMQNGPTRASHMTLTSVGNSERVTYNGNGSKMIRPVTLIMLWK